MGTPQIQMFIMVYHGVSAVYIIFSFKRAGLVAPPIWRQTFVYSIYIYTYIIDTLHALCRCVVNTVPAEVGRLTFNYTCVYINK